MAEESANPQHYASLAVSPIDLMDSSDIAIPFAKGSAIKHLTRKKDGLVDLHKAVWYCIYIYVRVKTGNHKLAMRHAIGITKQLERVK